MQVSSIARIDRASASSPSVSIRTSTTCAVVVLLITAATAFSETTTERCRTRRYSSPREAGGALFAPTGAEATKSYFGFVGRADAGYRFADFRIAAQGSFASFVLASGTVGDTKIESRSSIIGVKATAWYGIPIGAALVPYVGGGLAMVIRDVTTAVGDDTQSASETDFGTQGGVGVNVPLSTALDLRFGYRIVAPLGDPSLQLFHNADVGILYRMR